ncbi:MAG: hypothetical protein QNJ88_07890 [Acidimicrobiia bacterium]|nr:hypothetical protein [Acidimicrobiia bacterium]
MTGIAHAIIAIVQLSLGVYGTVRARRKPGLAIVLVVAVVFGLAYDNVVLALGAVVDAGPLLEALNAPRYWVHGLLTPTTMWAAFAALAMAGHPTGTSRAWRGVITSLTAAMAALGAWIDVVGLDLEPATEQGITRYVNSFEPVSGPPIASVVTIVVVLVIGIRLWRDHDWPWLAAGASIMFVTAAVPGPILLLQSVGEVAFAAGLVTALTHDWHSIDEGEVVAHPFDERAA